MSPRPNQQRASWEFFTVLSGTASMFTWLAMLRR